MKSLFNKIFTKKELILKVIQELYLLISFVFGRSISEIFFDKNITTTWLIIFIFGCFYTIWWVYRIIKRELKNI